MAEHYKTISDARQNLPNLSREVQESSQRFVITNQGKPQSVLLGYQDYEAMRAATELAMRPEAMESIRRGLAQHEAGTRLTPDEVREDLQDSFPPVKTRSFEFSSNPVKPKRSSDKKRISAITKRLAEKETAKVR